MDYSLDYASQRIAADASADARATFIRRTYGHLAGAILAFAALETVLLKATPPEVIQGLLNRGTLMIMMIAFMGVAWMANKWALSGASPAMQYAGLGLYVVAEAIIFLPLMYIAANFFDDVIPKAGIMTLAMFAGLTFAVFVTRQDFSFLAPILSIGVCLSIGLIATSWIFGFNMGNWFAFGMVALASAFILYDTSNVLHRYRTDQHVAASLALFASVALLFWYILQIFMSRGRN